MTGIVTILGVLAMLETGFCFGREREVTPLEGRAFPLNPEVSPLWACWSRRDLGTRGTAQGAGPGCSVVGIDVN